MLDNYLINISIFVLCLFFFYKNTDETFYYFAYLIVILLCINSVYSLFEVAVVSLDDNCRIYKKSEQTIFCTIIAAIDVSYTNPTFSSALADYIQRSENNPQAKIEMTRLIANSSSIGWVSLMAGRSGGIFNMPIASSAINTGGLLLIFILFFLDTKNNLKKLTESKKKYYCIAFFLLLLSSILSVSKITSHFTLPVVFFLILLNRKELKFIISSKCFKLSAAAFFLVLILLVNLKWKGYYHYYQHALRYLIIMCDIKKIECKFSSEIVVAKKIDFNKIYLESKIKTANQNTIVQKYHENENENLNKVELKTKKETLVDNNYFQSRYKNIGIYLNILSGGRHGAVDPLSIMNLKKKGSILGYGVIIQQSFDQMKNYLIFYSGRLSRYIYLIFVTLPFILFILYKNKFKNTRIPIVLIMIFSLYSLGSLGAPIYFMNRVSVIYFAALAYFLIKLDAIKNNKNNV